MATMQKISPVLWDNLGHIPCELLARCKLLAVRTYKKPVVPHILLNTKEKDGQFKVYMYGNLAEFGLCKYEGLAVKKQRNPLMLTDCDLVTPYGNIHLGQHWLK